MDTIIVSNLKSTMNYLLLIACIFINIDILKNNICPDIQNQNGPNQLKNIQHDQGYRLTQKNLI